MLIDRTTRRVNDQEEVLNASDANRSVFKSGSSDQLSTENLDYAMETSSLFDREHVRLERRVINPHILYNDHIGSSAASYEDVIELDWRRQAVFVKQRQIQADGLSQ